MTNNPMKLSPFCSVLGEGQHVVSFGLSEIVKDPNPSINGGRVHRMSARELHRAAERFHRKEMKKEAKKAPKKDNRKGFLNS